MARPKNPESRTETIATRVSAETAGKIAQERGHLTRSEWLARLIEDHFEGGASARGTAREAATETGSPEVRTEPAAEPALVPPSVVERQDQAGEIEGLRDGESASPGRGKKKQPCTHYVPRGTTCKICR